MTSGALLDRLTIQVDNIHPPILNKSRMDIDLFNLAISRTEKNISCVRGENERGFNALISGHYATFIYYFSRIIWEFGGDDELATRLFLLNKSLNGIDLFYEVLMPDYFIIRHTVGAVFAKADYGEYCVFHQGCTVGRFGDDRPTIGSGVVMYPGSAVIGASRIGNNCVISAGVQVLNEIIPDNSTVFSGSNGKSIIKPLSVKFADRFFL